jgi:hypothetical protein
VSALSSADLVVCDWEPFEMFDSWPAGVLSAGHLTAGAAGITSPRERREETMITRATLSDGTVARFYFDNDGRCRLAWRLTDEVFGIYPRPIGLPQGAADGEFFRAAVAEVAAKSGPADLRVVSMS